MKSPDEILSEMKTERIKNNDPWMRLISIAAKHDPYETAECLEQIGHGDKKITGKALDLAAALRESIK